MRLLVEFLEVLQRRLGRRWPHRRAGRPPKCGDPLDCGRPWRRRYRRHRRHGHGGVDQEGEEQPAGDPPMPPVAKKAVAGARFEVALRRPRREVLRHVVELFLGARRQHHQFPLVVGEHSLSLVVPRRKLAAVLEPALLNIRRDLAPHGSRRWSSPFVCSRRGRARKANTARCHGVGELEGVEVEAVRRRPRRIQSQAVPSAVQHPSPPFRRRGVMCDLVPVDGRPPEAGAPNPPEVRGVGESWLTAELLGGLRRGACRAISTFSTRMGEAATAPRREQGVPLPGLHGVNAWMSYRLFPAWPSRSASWWRTSR